MPQPARVPVNTSSIINAPEVWEFQIPGGLVLAVPDSDFLLFLNASAAFIWAEVRLGSDRVLIESRFAAAFGVPCDIAQRDVVATLAGWADAPLPRPFDLSLNGKRFRLILDSPELEAEILPRLTHLASLTGEPDFVVHVPVERSVSASRALLLQELVRLSRGPGQWLALMHAGACANSKGCIVFPAASGSGKSTLAAALLHSGLACQADDSVGIEPGTLLIPPMPFAMAIREGSWPVLAPRSPGFESLAVATRFGQQIRFLAPATQAEPVPAVALVFPRFDPASPTETTELSPLDTLIELREAGFWVEHTRSSIQAFLDWVQSLPSHRLVYSDVDEAVAFFRDILTSRT